ncbi:hypothetical protein [Persicirhabdus sediminis]|uniref:Lipoprotein n=1 Tax=Persicirhabdus sediminis TaxID=454144 RepID=A0A8J7MER0_9BACT|nr:hypothetical protein [Persicirhabdus sediminis]MBK1791362.1 hypothetical protein [Persicirhabdus sediminis]
MQFNEYRFAASMLLVGVVTTSGALANYDPSNPASTGSQISATLGYRDFKQGEAMTEMRMNWGLTASPNDVLNFDFGYGWHDGNARGKTDSGLTTTHFSWIHDFGMDTYMSEGYQGLASAFELDLAGRVRGTGGQNVLSFSMIPGFGMADGVSAYMGLGLTSSWDKDFARHNGLGFDIAPSLIFRPYQMWQGGYVEVVPRFKSFFTGNLSGETATTLEINTGGNITQTFMWTCGFQKNFNVDLETYRHGRYTSPKNDWRLNLGLTKSF